MSLLVRRWNPFQRARTTDLPKQRHVFAGDLLLLLNIIVLLWLCWRVTARTVTITVDDMTETVQTHRRTIEHLLVDLDLSLQQHDRLIGGNGERLFRNSSLRIDRARPFRILSDGRDISLSSWGGSAWDVLRDAGVAVEPSDQVVINGKRFNLHAPLPARVRNYLPATFKRGYAWEYVVEEPLQMRVYRSIPITIDDGSLPYTIRTTAETVGAALRQAQITIFLGDEVQPSMESPVTTGLRVFIDRSTPVSLRVDHQDTKTRTQARTVGDTLTELEIGLSGLDEVTPPLDTELYENIEIYVKRIRQDIEVEENIVPFETVYQPDRNLLIDTQQMINPGSEGITRRRERVQYEDDEEVSRVLEDTWIAQKPAQRVIAYGQRIEPNTATMPDGQTITYWRQIRMKATSYGAGTAGVSSDQPYYGRTYTGDVMRKGIVAIDPQVIPLRSKLYIPNYGYGDALDTGSAIRARRIDLGYDDDNLVLWNSWVDVYVLWPPPPEYQITWVLPNWPPLPR